MFRRNISIVTLYLAGAAGSSNGLRTPLRPAVGNQHVGSHNPHAGTYGQTYRRLA